MRTIIQEEGSGQTGDHEPAEVLSIYEAMQHLSDTRRRQGTRYPLALVLTYILLAKAAGETTLLG